MIRLLVDAVRDVSARFASRRFALVLVLVLALPAIFALVFTAATAPALDGQARIPVAVVNLDEGIDGARGSTVNSGAELVDDLMDSSELAWDAVDEDTALAGLTDGTYALVLEIPADYSEKVASVDGSDPARARSRSSRPARRTCLPRALVPLRSSRCNRACAPIWESSTCCGS